MSERRSAKSFQEEILFHVIYFQLLTLDFLHIPTPINQNETNFSINFYCKCLFIRIL
jgi:hypothetical protein